MEKAIYGLEQLTGSLVVLAFGFFWFFLSAMCAAIEPSIAGDCCGLFMLFMGVLTATGFLYCSILDRREA